MKNRRTVGSALVGAAALVLTSFVAVSTPAQAAALSITATPSTNLTDGQVISVKGNAGKANAPKLYVAVCESAVPTATNCNTDLTGFGTPEAHILQVTPNATTGAWGPFSFKLRQNILTGDHDPVPFNCLVADTCVIGTTNSVNPADHTYNTIAPLHFVNATPPVRTSGPNVTGTVRTGTRVTCSVAYTGATYRQFEWLRNGALIAGAKASTYVPTASDYNRYLSCRSRAANAGGYGPKATSPNRLVAKGAALRVVKKPTVSGTGKVGKTLTAGHGTWTPSATSYGYQWLRDGKTIKSATKYKYKLVSKDKGHKVKCKIVAKRYAYNNGTGYTPSKTIS